MNNKIKLSFVFLLICLLILVGCKSKREGFDQSDETEDTLVELENSTPIRKIIYKVNADLTTNNLTESVTKIKDQLYDDEWLDSEVISENRASLVIRVKTERLDDFINSITQSYDVSNFNKTATDISLTYQDKSNLLLTYQTERERLLELYVDASLSDMILINNRFSEIDIEIGKLQGELNQFDSLVDYSEVRLNLYYSKDSDILPIGRRILNAFSDGLSSLVTFFDILIIVLATLVPWTIVIAPAVYGVYYFRKHDKKKKISTKDEKKL
ncbi:MAG: hypothetical protein K0Q49_2158 [Haloplasmataceae bacterium]|jgi:uncharacterized protein YcfL|nr:hypothetical protein [Haloplasmataceae bacterium]